MTTNVGPEETQEDLVGDDDLNWKREPFPLPCPPVNPLPGKDVELY